MTITMSEKLKIGVLIVTFNNAEMLRSVIGAVVSQTRKPDEIVVIDNASPDNTREVVKEFQDVRYIRLDENTGSAGGFHEGIKTAVENNDFVMILDDDIGLESNAIEIMERYLKTLSKEYKLGAVRCRYVGQNRVEEVRKITGFAFRGTIISKGAIMDVGLPKKEYFLYAEDADYAYRMNQKGWDMFIVPEHLIADKREKAKLKVTVFGRDSLLYKERFRFYYAFRNQIDMYIKYKMWVKLTESLVYALKIIVLFVVLKRTKSFGFIRAIIDGIWDGFRSKLGKNPKYLPGGHAD